MNGGDINFILQKVKNRTPVFTGRFHTDITALVFDKPVFELQDRIVKSGETLFLIQWLNARSKMKLTLISMLSKTEESLYDSPLRAL